MVEVENRVMSGLLGVAARDALGATVEFLSPSDIRRRFGVHREIVGGGSFNWRPGDGTDDTNLTWAVLAANLDGPYTLRRAAGRPERRPPADPPYRGRAPDGPGVALRR